MRACTLLMTGLLLLSATTQAQQAKKSLLYNLVNQQRQSLKLVSSTVLFKETTTPATASVNAIISNKTLLILDGRAAKKTYIDKPATISLSVPSGKGFSWQLELVQQDINTSHDFTFGTLDARGTHHKNSGNQGVHYRGYINGDPSSFACFSLFANGEVMGIFCNNAGNYTIGKLNNTGLNYIVYNNKDLKVPINFNCTTKETSPAPVARKKETVKMPSSEGQVSLACKKISIYWEVDYKLFHNNFSDDTAATQNYVSGVFNQVASMYQNEGIQIELRNSCIWTEAAPYNTTSANAALDAFRTRWNLRNNDFKGDVAMLIDGMPTNNGGVAYMQDNGLCNRNYAFGYGDVYGTYNTVPVYSWDVHVLTHELGHLLGAHHTHWCGWNTGPDGQCGAIDNCYTLEAGDSCSTCPVKKDITIDVGGFTGTIMSYCHLVSGVGINLANGFGPLPGEAIRNTVSQSGCSITVNRWTGTVNTAWENTGNWNCGTLPDANTEVIIAGGLPNYPIVKSTAICKSIHQSPGSSLRVNTGFQLIIVGEP